MKKYNKPELLVVFMQGSDVITLSILENGESADDILSLELGAH